MANLVNQCADLWRCHDRRPTVAWAYDNVHLVPPFSRVGPFDTRGSRHFDAVFSALDDERCREVNILAPVRSGKTLIADIATLNIIVRAPGPLLWIFQEENSAADQAEMRTWPLIMANAIVRDLLPLDRHKKRTQEIIFPTMPLHIKGPALSNLQSRGYRYAFCSEVWLYKSGRLDECRARLGDFVKLGTDKFLCESQAGTNGDEWDRQFQRGLLHEWSVSCMSCGKHFAPKWTMHRPDLTRAGMVWDMHKDANGFWQIAKLLPSIRFECPFCGHAHLDNPRCKSEWNRTGQYIVEDGPADSPSRSFHWNAIIDYPWTELVTLYLDAVNAWKLGAIQPLVAFFQKRMAEPKSETLILQETSRFSAQTTKLAGELPDKRARLLTVDRQNEDVYWAMVRDWGDGGHSHRIFFGKLFSAAEIEAKRIELNILPQHTLIDSGYRPKGDHGVYGHCIRHGWIPLKGVATEGGDAIRFRHKVGERIVERSYSEPVWVDPEIGTAGGGRAQVEMVRFSSPTYKDRVRQLIDSSLWLEPEADPDDALEIEYRRQMTAEYKKPKRDKFSGRTKFVWVCPSGNNHAFDCAAMQAVGATLLDILPDE